MPLWLGQGPVDRRPAIHLALGPYMPRVAIHDPFYGRESDPRSREFGQRVESLKRREEPFHLLLDEPGAVVLFSIAEAE